MEKLMISRCTSNGAAVEMNISKTIRALLQGETPPDVDPAAFGPYAEYIEELFAAQQQDGVKGARRTFESLLINEPELAQLVAGDPKPCKTSWTDQELAAAQFPSLVWLVSQLLTIGLVVLAGMSKIGKSWLVLQLARAVAGGTPFLGHDVNGGNVLFLALEDPGGRRLQGRLIKQGNDETGRLFFETDWPYLSDGGFDQLREYLTTDHYVLVIIDTFSRAVGNLDQLKPADMTMLFGKLQQLAIEFETVILLVDHHPKNGRESRDPVRDIYGATAKGAVVDTALGLYRDTNDPLKAELLVTGRDIESRELLLSFDEDSCTWNSLGDADDIREGTFPHEVYATIRELWTEGVHATNGVIAKRLEADKGQVTRATNQLKKHGKIVRGESVSVDGSKVKPFVSPTGSKT